MESFSGSCEKISPNVEVEIVFREVTIKTESVSTEDSLTIELEFLGRKIEVANFENGNQCVSFSNGCHSVDLHFKLSNEASDVSDEEIIFNLLGNPLSVNVVKLSNTSRKSLELRKSLKKLKDVKPKINVFASGSINLLENLKKFQNNDMKIFHVTLKPLEGENVEICAQFELKFMNFPNIDSTLSASVLQLYNLPLDDGEEIEIAFHFPERESKFQTVMLHPECSKTIESVGFLRDDSLKNVPLHLDDHVPSKFIYHYENIQTLAGFEFLVDLITSNGKLLLELRWRKQVFMSFLDLEIFNYEGINGSSFVVPLYHHNKKIIADQFQQDLCAFPQEEKPIKKGKEKRGSKKPEEVDESEIKPLMIEDEHVLMKVHLKMSQPLTPEISLEDLKAVFNQETHFIEEISLKGQIIAKSEKDFEKIIREISRKMEQFIEDNPDLDCYDVERKIKRKIENGELFDKKLFKEIVKTLIGNKFNVETKTETNHEFKIFMIDVFKSLNKEMMKLLYKKKEKESLAAFEPMKVELRKVQIEEWILTGHAEKAEDFLRKHNESLEIFMEFSVFLLRIGKLKKCEEIVMKYLKHNQDGTFGYYLIAYLMIDKGRIDFAILAMKILTKLQKNNMEFWLLLTMLYEKINYKAGLKHCMMNIHATKFLTDGADEFDSLVFPKLKLEDDISNILNRQLKLKLTHFVELTKKFMETSLLQIQNHIEELQLNFIEFIEKGNFDDAEILLRNIEITNENEMLLRIMKGNLFFETDEQWKGICQYEIAYNICLRKNIKFPHLLAIRCGDWYEKETDNLQKVRRYFNHSCKVSPTFKACMGMGIVCYREMNFQDSEKYFAEANKIDKSSGDNWIYLALNNFKLNRQEMFAKCFLNARKFHVTNYQLVEEAEKILDF